MFLQKCRVVISYTTLVADCVMFSENLIISQVMHRIKDYIGCKSKGVIYLVTCEDCGKQYVDETDTAFLTRHYGHRSDLTKKPLLPLSKHFNQGNCAFENISIIALCIARSFEFEY